MGQIKSITYGRTINLGNHESERLEVTVELEKVYEGFHEGKVMPVPEDPQKAFKELKEWVLNQIYAKASAADKKTENPKTIKIPDPDNYGKFIEQPFPNVLSPE